MFIVKNLQGEIFAGVSHEKISWANPKEGTVQIVAFPTIAAASTAAANIEKSYNVIFPAVSYHEIIL